MIQRFDDLIIWQKSQQLLVELHLLSVRVPDATLKTALLEYGVATPSRIAEGFQRGSNPEFRKLLSAAMGSLAATRSLLYLIERLYPEFLPETTAMQQKSAEIQQSTLALIFKLKASMKKRPAAKPGATS